jgi:purine-cytosine permease-like protein
MFPAVLLLNVGFIAAELVIQAQSINAVTAALTTPASIAVLAIPSVVIGIVGYRWIHRVMQAARGPVGRAQRCGAGLGR